MEDLDTIEPYTAHSGPGSEEGRSGEAPPTTSTAVGGVATIREVVGDGPMEATVGAAETQEATMEADEHEEASPGQEQLKNP